MLDVISRPFAQTTSGKPFPLINPLPSDVDWYDVASALACINRYTGNAGVYSVAQHSILVAKCVPEELRLHGLLHDAKEFAMGDLTRPAKLALAHYCGDAFEAGLKRLENSIDFAIYTAAGLPFPVSPEIRGIVKHADLRVTVTEKRDVVTPMVCSTEEWLLGQDVVSPLPETIVPWNPEHARQAFITELKRYGLGY